MTDLLVTGGLGFIGAAFVRRRATRGDRVTVVDARTYAADERRLEAAAGRVGTIAFDVADEGMIDVLARVRPRIVVHFAAESHVTRSETAPGTAFRTNVDGTRRVLRAAADAAVDLVVHISTDEVYGPCSGPAFREDDKRPGEGLATSPYARSKALADDLALGATDVPVVVVRMSNCFGPWQRPEKAVARWSCRAVLGRRLPVWGDGGQVRDWLYVEDAVDGIETIMAMGTPGRAYNLAPGGEERSNLEVARAIAAAAGLPPDAVYLTAYDRPMHDRRYAIDSTRVRALGWSPATEFGTGIAATVAWYREHRAWWEPLLDEDERLYRDDEERVGPHAG